jgi:hypothetical protein
MRQAVNIQRFSPFKVGSVELSVSHLQYADDTVFIGEANVENLWTIKAILRGFELASGLKVNFWKSCLMGVNISEEFMVMASRFLNCRIGRAPFKYLGLPVGANPRRVATWQPMIDVLKNRLNSWGNRFLSVGGRIVLLNSVLSAIPIFYLSFMKMPVKVWKEVVKIQRDFLWGGLEKKRKISWVCWDTVTKPKIDGGLGVRDLRRVNLSLLAKWRWRFLNSDRCFWRSVLEAKYGESLAVGHIQHDYSESRMASTWWRDICKLEGDERWFVETTVKKLGDGNMTELWNDAWLGTVPLKDRFPRLFSISTLKEAKVAEAGIWVNNSWCWSLTWRRNFFVWEEEMHIELMALLHGTSPSVACDKWVWTEGAGGVFSVNSCYRLLTTRAISAEVIPSDHKFVFVGIWRSAAPLKAIVFSWQALIGKIPTRSNLLRRGVGLGGGATGCCFCGAASETPVHLLLHCGFAAAVWYRVLSWLGFNLVNPPNLFISFASFLGITSLKKRKKGLAVIWHALIWVIWKVHNDRIFNAKLRSVEEVVESVQVTAWRWWLGRATGQPCLWYEWLHEPICCLDA